MRQRHRYLWAIALVINCLLHSLALASPVFVQQLLAGETGRNIRHLPCVSRRTGETGVCMFAFTCAKANGTHLGTCIDRFYFGSCCKIDDEPDIFPQDNTIDIDNPVSLPKPYVTTTTMHTLESNDIPGNVDKSKPSTKLTTEAVSLTTKVSESTTVRITEQTKIKPLKSATKKPIITESTTESIRLSTFQSVQNASEQRPVTMPSTNTVAASKRPQRPSIPNTKPVSSRPSSVSTTSVSISASTMASSTSTLPSTSITTVLWPKPAPTLSSTLVTDQHNVTSKRPSSTLGLIKKPTSTIGITVKPELSGTTVSSFNTTSRNITDKFTSTTHRVTTTEVSKLTTPLTTTQRTPPVTRFPPRNATTSFVSTTETKVSNQPTTTSSTNKDFEEIQKPTATRKPPTTKKPTKVTTKRPSTAVKRPSPFITTRRPTTASPVTTSTATSIISLNVSNSHSFGTKITSTVPTITVIRNTTATATTTTSSKNPSTITTTKRPSTVTKKPTTTTTVRSTTIRRPTVTTLRKNLTSSASHRPTTTTLTKLTTTTRKPSTASSVPSSTTTTESNVIITTAKPTTLKITDSTTAGTKVTEIPNKVSLGISVMTTPSVATVKDTPTSITTAQSTITLSETNELNLKPVTQAYATTSSGTSPTNQKNMTNLPLSTVTESTVKKSTVSNEVDTELDNEMAQTTLTPGIVTWTSFTDEVENSTKIPEYSSIAPDTTELEWTPITTPDGWIIIQSPTTEKLESKPDVEVKPILPTTETPILSAKPVTESTTTTTQRVTTQPTTYVDMLSTLATVTVSPEFTEPSMASFNMSNFKEVCGRRLFPEPRIVGGDGSTFGKWPWQISLRQWRTTSYLHKCGAALLNENWAITAAHCVQNVLPTDLLLRMGEHDLGNEKEPYVFQERRVQIVASHPNFDPRTFEFDLALMRFYEPILPFQPNVLPICIPDDDEDYVGRTAFVTGWGRLYEDGPLPSVLQEVAVPIINNSICEGMYRNAGYIEHIPQIFICAGWRKGGFDSCEGDSGGPLVIQRKRDKRWVLAGVISWGIGCAEPNQPGVYTRISEFREWINQILQF